MNPDRYFVLTAACPPAYSQVRTLAAWVMARIENNATNDQTHNSSPRSWTRPVVMSVLLCEGVEQLKGSSVQAHELSAGYLRQVHAELYTALSETNSVYHSPRTLTLEKIGVSRRSGRYWKGIALKQNRAVAALELDP